ncbi:MAG: hypothetical protein KY451_00855 [Actinobacteria bacterium]|nr:hypothetical protein [Actinomycetota bacterium]
MITHRQMGGRVRRLLALVLATLSLAAGLVAAGTGAQASSASLRLGAISGLPGTTVGVTVTGFPRKASGALTFDGTVVGSFRTSNRGTYSGSLVVPSVSARTATISAAAGSTSASASFVVLAPAEPVASPTSPTTVTSSPPAVGGYAALKPVGSWNSLPTDAQAAALVRRSSWEPRPDNARANSTTPSALALGAHGGVEPIWNSWLLPRVTGNFTGTTDEIIQWAAHKWGLPDEVLRAQMISESYWYQGLLDSSGKPINGKGFGDYSTNQAHCPPGYTAPCPLSFGVLQIKYSAPHPGTFPHSRDSTAFNLDYVAGLMRGCYEGWETWLRDWGSETGPSNYAAGDLYGCLGRWYSGQWHTSPAEGYISSVKNHFSTKPWLNSGF